MPRMPEKVGINEEGPQEACASVTGICSSSEGNRKPPKVGVEENRSTGFQLMQSST